MSGSRLTELVGRRAVLLLASVSAIVLVCCHPDEPEAPPSPVSASPRAAPTAPGLQAPAGYPEDFPWVEGGRIVEIPQGDLGLLAGETALVAYPRPVSAVAGELERRLERDGWTVRTEQHFEAPPLPSRLRVYSAKEGREVLSSFFEMEGVSFVQIMETRSD